MAENDKDRCPHCETDYYPAWTRHDHLIKSRIVAELGGGRDGPYTGTYFRSTRDTDIEHIVV